MRVVLSGNPSTGYTWEPSANNDKVLAPGGVKTAAPPGSKPGASAVQTLTFTAKAAGSDQLVLAYRRPWEKSTAPARSYTLNVTITEQGAIAVTPKGLMIGEYAGKLPCADCSGVLTSIAFYAAGRNEFLDTYYVTIMKYLDVPGGEHTAVIADEWTLNRGSAADKNATVYCLYSNASNNRTNYQLQGDTLVALDPDLKVIQSPFNLNLTKTH